MLIAMFILSLAVGLGLPKPFWKGLRRDTGYHEYFMYFFLLKNISGSIKKDLCKKYVFYLTFAVNCEILNV